MYKDKLILTISDYLGPASKRFVERQIEFHLDKDRESEVLRTEVKKFADAAKTELKSILDDEELVDECYERMLQLINDGK